MSIQTQDIRTICQDAVRWRALIEMLSEGVVGCEYGVEALTAAVDTRISWARAREVFEHGLTQEVRS